MSVSAHVCVCVCVCACVHVCMRACVHVCVYLWVRAYLEHITEINLELFLTFAHEFVVKIEEHLFCR